MIVWSKIRTSLELDWVRDEWNRKWISINNGWKRNNELLASLRCCLRNKNRKEGYSDNPDKSFSILSPSLSPSLSLLIQSNVAPSLLKIKINFLCYFIFLNKFLSADAVGSLVETLTRKRHFFPTGCFNLHTWLFSLASIISDSTSVYMNLEVYLNGRSLLFGVFFSLSKSCFSSCHAWKMTFTVETWQLYWMEVLGDC